MRTGTRNVLVGLAVVVAVQAVLAVAYRAMDRGRGGAPFAEVRPGRPLPPLVLESSDGSPSTLPDGPWVLHVWATWCPSCREELPWMIREARRAGVPLRAVSLDRDWALVRVLFGGDVPPEVVREPAGTLAPALGIENLPDSFAVDAAGRVVARFPSLAPDEVGRIDLDALGGTR